MGRKTGVSYADSSCNPIMGCSPGCSLYSPDPKSNHCYAATLINRYAGRKGWPKHFSQPEHFLGRLEKAIKWSDLTGKERPDKPWLNERPRIIFVNDLSDGFCPSVNPERWLAPHLEAMAESPHIWLLLTKWPKKMRLFCELHPLPENVWPGVTVMRRKDTWRIEELSQIKASVRWVSLEPMLEAIDLGKAGAILSKEWWVWGNTVSWCVIGGESGPNARPMMTNWAQDIVRQCQAANVPVFMKQMGAWAAKFSKYTNRKGADMSEWPIGLRVREFPQ